MAKGVYRSPKAKLGKVFSGTLIEGPPSKAFRGNPMGLSELIPPVTGNPVEGFPADFGAGKITASKGNAGIIRPTTKPKKG